MGQKVKKSTKKFLQKGMDGELKKRKAHKTAVKIRDQKEQRLQALVQRHEADDSKKAAHDKAAAEMDVDDFLDGGFEDLGGESDMDSDVPSGSDGEEEGSDIADSEEDEGKEEEGGGDDSSSDMDDEDVIRMLAQSREAEEQGNADDASESSSGEEEEEDPVVELNNKLKSSISGHKEQLERLKEQDPEFFKYLMETDKGLLDFTTGEGEDGEEGEEEEEGSEEEGEESEEEGGAKGRIVATAAAVEGWCAAAKERASIPTMQVLMKAYRAACHYGGEDNDDAVSNEFLITSPAVFNKLMIFVLQEAHGIFIRMLGMEGKKTITSEDVEGRPRWAKVEPIIRTYVGNTLEVLHTVTDRNLIAFVLRRLRPSVPFLGPMTKIRRKLLKQAVRLFAEGDRKVRIQAFLLVREMGMALPDPALEEGIKALVKAFANAAKHMTAASVPHLNFMATCITEILSVDPIVSYALAFSYIKQLAMRMRVALTQGTKESYRECYNWQFINCLELWARVISAHRDKPELRPLIYPVTQLLMGAARLVPTPRYFPLRLRCVAVLNQLSQATETFSPSGAILLEMLDFAGFKKKARAPGAAHDFNGVLRVSKAALRTARFQEISMDTLLHHLAEHLAQWSCHVAFPELAYPVLVRLRRFAKATSVEKLRRQVRTVATAVERNMVWVGSKRDTVDFSPKDADAIGHFLASDKAKGSSPMLQLAAQLADKIKQRQTAMRVGEVVIGEEAESGEEDDSGSEEYDGGDVDGMDVDGTGEDEEETASDGEWGEDGGVGRDDVVKDFEMSDSDSDDDDGVGVEASKGKGRGKKGRSGKAKGGKGGEQGKHGALKAGGGVKKGAGKKRYDGVKTEGQHWKQDKAGSKKGKGKGKGEGK